jgi:hypothetical protein
MKKISSLFFLILILVFHADTALPTDSKGSAVEGKVVGKDGRPIAGVKVVAILPGGEYKEGYEQFEAETKSDGKFVLKGLYPGTYYRIVVYGGQCNDQRERIRSLPSGETMKLKKDFVLVFSPFKVSSDGVIKDLRTGLEWAPVPIMTVGYDLAASYARSLKLDGGGWRLPTVDELKGLHESGQSGCGLDWSFGNRYPKAWSTDPKRPSQRWIVSFCRDEVIAEIWDQLSPPCDDCRVMSVRTRQ